MRFKNGVKLQGVTPELTLAIMSANSVFEAEGCELVITSILDGEHSRNSLHYSGNAADFRTRGLHGTTIDRIVAALKGALTVDFDVIQHDTHIHIEHQPRFATNS
jgi:hypothetical protein